MAASMLEERLKRLENERRRIHAMAIAALILCAVGLFLSVPRWTLGRPQQGEQTIEAERFVLKDANGTTRALLQMGPSGPQLDLTDSEQHPLLTLVAGNATSGIVLRSSAGTPRAALLSVAGGVDQPTLALMGGNGKPRIFLTMTEDGPAISMHDSNGKERIELLVKGEVPSEHFYDADGQKVLSLAALANSTTVAVTDGRSKAAASLSVTRATGPSFLLLNRAGQPIYVQP
jgi:hypothetical protein